MNNKTTPEKYYNNNEHSMNVFKKKYMREDDIYVEDVFNRIINEISTVSCEDGNNIKEYKKIWFDTLFEGYWRAGGSILAALNKPEKNISVFNCSGLVIREDTLESIFLTRYQAAKIAAYRQGFGVLFDVIRPKDAPINNSAEISEGVVHWMKSFDNIGLECGQKSRFPAQLFALNIKHPDIIDFIKAKTDLNAIQNANISVIITSDFMEQLRNNGEWILRFDFDDKNKKPIIKKINARELYNLIIETMYNTAEPGVLFLDRLRDWSIQEAFGYKIEITNAPLVYDTLVTTDKGLIKIGDLYNKYVNNNLNEKVFVDVLINKFLLGLSADKNYYSFEVERYPNQKKVKIELETGLIIECNEEHLWYVINFGLIEARKLNNTHKLILPINTIWSNIVFSVDDSDFNDGYIFGLYKNNHDLFKYNNKIKISNKYYTNIKKYFDEHSIVYDVINEDIVICEEIIPIVDKKYSSGVFCSGYLSALFEDKVRVINDNGNIKIIIDTLNIKDDIQDILKLLLTFNIIGYYDIDNNVIIIKDLLSMKIFTRCIKSYLQKWEIEELFKCLNNKLTFEFRTLKVKDVIITNNYEDMYCIKIPNTNGFYANGILSSNCGEKPIPDKGVCCLASLNMAKVPHIKDGDISKLDDFLSWLIPPLVRFMDNVVQYEIDNPHKSPLQQQLQLVKDLREIGIGITNLHKWFFDQGVEYASKKAKEMVDIFFKRLQYYTFKASCELAKERGPCEAYKKAKENNIIKETGFLKHLFDEYPDLRKLFYKYGIRNSSLLSIAPTGCVAKETKITILDNFIKHDGKIKEVNFEDILKYKGIDVSSIESNKLLSNKWYILKEPITIVVDGAFVDVNKIYYCGHEPYITIEFEDDSSVNVSYKHEFFIKDEFGNEREIYAFELKPGMELVE